MLNHISLIWEYRDFLSSQETYLDSSQFKRLHSSLFRSALHKLRKLDPGLVSDLLFSLYSCQGRPAIDPAILIRSFVLMQHRVMLLSAAGVKYYITTFASVSE